MVGDACRGGSAYASCCVHTYVHSVYVGYREKWAAGTPALLAMVLLEQSIYTYHYTLACVCTCMCACVCVCMHTYVCDCVHTYVCMHVLYALNFLVHLLQVKALHKLKTISELLRKSTVSCVVGGNMQSSAVGSLSLWVPVP